MKDKPGKRKGGNGKRDNAKRQRIADATKGTRKSTINFGKAENCMSDYFLRLGFQGHLKRYIEDDIKMVNRALLNANKYMREIYASLALYSLLIFSRRKILPILGMLSLIGSKPSILITVKRRKL